MQYIIKRNDDELIHRNHKYLYKKKVNGKWRYYYDVGKRNWRNGNHNIGDDGQETDSNIRGYTKIQDIMGYDEKERRDRAIGRYENKRKTYENQKNMTFDELSRKNISLEESFTKMTNEGAVASRAIDEFGKTPLGKIEKMNNLIDSGKNRVADILEKLAEKIRN